MEAKDIDQNSKPLHRESSKMKVRSILRPGWTLYGRTPLKWKSRNVGYVQFRIRSIALQQSKEFGIQGFGFWYTTHVQTYSVGFQFQVEGLGLRIEGSRFSV